MENCIYYFRGGKVILCSDLANIWNVNTKRINENVSRNEILFTASFSFVLSDSETEELLAAFSDQKKDC